MPANASPEFVLAEREYQKAVTNEEKIKALKKMLAMAPKHKGMAKTLAEIKIKISKLNALLQREKKLKRAGKVSGIGKQGDATVCFFSEKNTGKSYWLNTLTGTKLKSTPVEFETTKPEVGILDFQGVKIQLIEIPSCFDGFAAKYPNHMSILRMADLVVVFGNDETPRYELQEADLEIKTVVFEGKTKYELEDFIWEHAGLMRIFTKQPRRKAEKKAMGLKIGSNVRKAAREIHKDFENKFEFARVWGKSAKHPAMRVGLKHVLKEGDIVEFHIKK